MDYASYKKNNLDGTLTVFYPVELCYIEEETDSTLINKDMNVHIEIKPLAKTKLFEIYKGICNSDVSNTCRKGMLVDNKEYWNEYCNYISIGRAIRKLDYDMLASLAPNGIIDKERNIIRLRGRCQSTVLQYLFGFRFVPVRVNEKDYNTQYNERDIAIVEELIKSRMYEELDYIPEHMKSDGFYDITNIYTPILHPRFFDIEVTREKDYPTRMDIIDGFFSNTIFEGVTFLDIGSNLSYISHCFAREGGICTCIEYVEQRARLAKAITKMYQLESKVEIYNCSFFDFSIKKKYDVGIILSIFYHWSTKVGSDGKDFLEKLDQLIDKALIWESGDEAQKEKSLIISETKFKNYTKIGDTFGTGKKRELGVFTREGFDFETDF